MTMDGYDAAIEKANTYLKEIQNEAEALVPEFKRVIADFIIEWARKLIERNVVEKHEITRSLTKERLAQLKRSSEIVYQEIPVSTQEALSKDKIWPHRVDLPKGFESKHMTSYELLKTHTDLLNEAMREVIGKAGVLLLEYGYAVASQRDWEPRTNKTPRYAYGIPTHDNAHATELDTLNKRYSKAFESYMEATKELRKVKNEKASFEAKNLWDKA